MLVSLLAVTVVLFFAVAGWLIMAYGLLGLAAILIVYPLLVAGIAVCLGRQLRSLAKDYPHE